MERLLALCFFFMALVVVGVMIKQALSGKRPLLSIRNVFLVGLIIFQLTSAGTSYYLQHYGELPIGDPIGSGVKFLGIITTFLIIFFTVDNTGWFTFNIQNRIRLRAPIPGTGAMVILALASLAVSAILLLLLKNLGLIGILSELIGVGLAAMAAGTAAWIWSTRPRDPGLILFMILVVGAAAGLSMFESFGRRGLVSVMVATIWGAYHGGFKYFSYRRTAVPMTIIAIGGFLMVAAFTSTRGEKGRGTGLVESFTRLADANVVDGAFQLMAGQDAAGCSLWVIENRPEPFPYEPLNSVLYATLNPIPRSIWPGKPMGLGSTMVTQSMVTGKGEDYSVGPGLVGHIVDDNPWITLWLYPILLAVWFRVLDDLLRRFPNHPYMVLPMGIELGEILGIARGEMGLFVFRAGMGMFAAFFGTLILARMLRAMGFAFAPAAAPDAGEETEAAPYALGAED